MGRGPGDSSIDALEDGPPPVGLVAMTRHHDGARWRPRPLSSRQAVLALLANTLSAQRQPGVAFRVLRQVMSGAQAVKGLRGEADDTVEALLRMVREAGRPPDARRSALERAAAQS